MIPLDPAQKSRQNGRILPEIALRRQSPWGDSPRARGCAICGSWWGLSTVDNGRAFCWTHHPHRAAQILAGRPHVYLETRPYPSRKTCERILRLAGVTKAPKGRRSKQKRAPRRRKRMGR